MILCYMYAVCIYNGLEYIAFHNYDTNERMVPVYETPYRILVYKQICRILEHVDEEDVMPILDVVDTERAGW